ncbi:MAG TPA: hypothetical protein VL418_17980 [Devosiaceae bacterium]|nr:hypothetical protein [Devosiaceae bacterium]
MHSAKISALLAVGGLAALMGVTGAWAQNYNAADAVATSSYGSIRCGQFTSMSPGHQAGIVRRMANDAPMQSLSTPLTPSINPMTGRQQPQPGSSSAVPNTPLTPGQLIAACQAVSPQSTLRGAFSRFNSGTGIPVGGS